MCGNSAALLDGCSGENGDYDVVDDHSSTCLTRDRKNRRMSNSNSTGSGGSGWEGEPMPVGDHIPSDDVIAIIVFHELPRLSETGKSRHVEGMKMSRIETAVAQLPQRQTVLSPPSPPSPSVWCAAGCRSPPSTAARLPRFPPLPSGR